MSTTPPLESQANRKDVLLRAAYDLLKQAKEAHYTLSAAETIVHYDNADCDGLCLMDDIAEVLGIEQ